MQRHLAIAALLWTPLALAAMSGIPANWTTPTAPIEIFDDVYWVGTEGLAAYLFVTDDGLILLDAGMPENAGPVAASIRELGFELTDIRFLLNSHAHLDHSGALAALKAESSAELIASEGDRYALEHGVYPGWEARRDLDFPPVEVDRVIDDGDTVSLGGVVLTANLTPGHSPGCTSWSFTAHDGDAQYRALVFCSASVALNRLAPENPQYPGIVNDYRTTFRRMRTMPVDAFLAPHAEQFDLSGKLARRDDGAENPFVDPQEKDRRLAEFEQAFDAALLKTE